MAADDPTHIRIRLMGVPCWLRGTQAPMPLSRKDAALLALVALGREAPRDRIAAWLWPDVPAKASQVNLRQRIFKLRQTCGHPLLDTGGRLALAAGIDVDVLEEDPPEAELLGGFDYGDLESLDRWIGAERERLLRQRIDRQVAAAARLESEGALAAGIELCERIVAAAPWHEHSWRRLMRLHYLRDDRAAAIATFERLEAYVRQEQGSRPSAETLELLQAVERQERAKAAPARLPDCLLHPPVMVGRGHALASLQAAWQGRYAALVLGEGGIGKSRLLATFLQDRPDVLRYRARPGEAASAYSTAVLLLREVLSRFSPVLDAETCAELSRLLPGLGTPPPGDGQQALLWQACEALLEAAHRQGLAGLAIDDLQHADSASLELLRWWVASERLGSLRFAFASRPLEPGPAAQWLADWTNDSTRIEVVQLGPLNAAELQQLIESLPLPDSATGGSVDARQRSQALFRHAGGHPFFTLETLKALVREPPRDAALLPAPASAQAMLRSSLDRLSPPARELAAVAALAGGDWDAELAPPLLGRTMLALAPAWAELEAAQVMQGAGFAHDLVREAALGLVPDAWRGPLHAQLAAAMAGRPQADPSRVAVHWWAAGRWSEAAGSLREAARRARQTGRLEACEAQLTQAAEAHARAGQAQDRFESLAQACTVALMRVDPAEMGQRLQALEDLVTSTDDQARLAILRAEAAFTTADHATALVHSTRAVADATPGSEVALDAQILHGHSLAVSGRIGEGVALLRAAAAESARRGLPERECNAFEGLAYALHADSRLAAAMQAQQRAVALMQGHKNRMQIGHALANLASIAHSAGQVALALSSACDADRLFDAIGVGGAHALWNHITLARNAPAAGRFDLSAQTLRRLEETSARAGALAEAYAQLARVIHWWWLGRPDQALQALPPLPDAAGVAVHARVLACRIKLLRQMGRPARPDAAALEVLDRALEQPRDVASLTVEWAPLWPPETALDRLQAAREALSAGGADGMARSLAVCEVERLLDIDPGAAALRASSLRLQLHEGLHSISYPPQAWLTLARALSASDAAAAAECRGHALAWIDSASLPGTEIREREFFLQGNPVNRELLAA